MIEFLRDLKGIQQERPLHVVFVCTANCCRSPLAEILFEKMLLEEAGCFNKFSKINILVNSAATYYSGFTMSRKSARVLIEEEQIDAQRCNAHIGKLLSEIESPDLILSMEEDHIKAIYHEFPEWDDISFTLDEFVKYDRRLPDHDIEDPIAGTLEDFRKIKNEIKADLTLLIGEFKTAGLLP